MSVTFTITNAPEVKTWCECTCVINMGQPIPDCPICKGKGGHIYQEPAPGYSVDLANESARAVLRLIGLGCGDDLWGNIDIDEMPYVRRRILMALNSNVSIEAELKPASHTPGGHAGIRIEHHDNIAEIVHMGARVHNAGLSSERIRRHIHSIDRLIELAQRENQPITFG